MRKIVTFTVTIIVLGCADETAPTRIPEIGIPYDTAREQLIAEGWKPQPAKCSERNLCSSDTPELATNLDTASTCGMFWKDTSSITVCGRSIPDGLLVQSVVAGP
jgi:hypothetical protein